METPRFGEEVFGLHVHPETRVHLKSASRWARIVAIMAMASAALTIVDIVLTLAGITASPGKEAGLAVQLFAAIIGVALAFFLLKFAQHVTTGVNDINQQELNIGLGHLRTYFKIFGILIIILLVFFFLMILFIVMAAGSLANA